MTYASSALADRNIKIKPTTSDLSEEDIREIVSSFFSIKWGLAKDEISTAKMSIQLWDFDEPEKSSSQVIEEFGGETPQWEIHVYATPGTNGEDIGTMGLSRTGKILWWDIRSQPFYETEPDLMAMGKIIVPTDADADPQDIYELTKEHLKSDYDVENPEQYRFQIALVDEKHFYQGFPVWIVYVFDGNCLLWKGAFGYTGLFMTLVPGEQEYKAYYVDEYEFPLYADHVLGYSWPNKTIDKIYRIQRGKVDEEEKKQISKELFPIYQTWKLLYPRGYRLMEDFFDEHYQNQ